MRAVSTVTGTTQPRRVRLVKRMRQDVDPGHYRQHSRRGPEQHRRVIRPTSPRPGPGQRSRRDQHQPHVLPEIELPSWQRELCSCFDNRTNRRSPSMKQGTRNVDKPWPRSPARKRELNRLAAARGQTFVTLPHLPPGRMLSACSKGIRVKGVTAPDGLLPHEYSPGRVCRPGRELLRVLYCGPACARGPTAEVRSPGDYGQVNSAWRRPSSVVAEGIRAGASHRLHTALRKPR